MIYLNKKMTLFLLGYFFLSFILPLTHCHAEGGWSENESFGVGVVTEPFRASHTENTCCEIHEQGHHSSNQAHRHFLLQDQMAAPRSTQFDYSTAAEPVFTAEEKSFNPLACPEKVVANEVPITSSIFLSVHSGLSPPALL
ncbi:MAG: hypothetical protein HY892_15795 [Deltaproteobacteria bacterium]|nr:hypothetical protein [Deltaproteobacteria bacterium]